MVLTKALKQGIYIGGFHKFCKDPACCTYYIEGCPWITWRSASFVNKALGLLTKHDLLRHRLGEISSQQDGRGILRELRNFLINKEKRIKMV